MYPEFFKIGSLSVQAYGVFFALAYLTAFYFLRRSAELGGYSKNTFSDLALLCLVSGVIGARLFFVVQNRAAFTDRWWEVFYFWSGGLVFFGGFVAATAFLVFYFRKKKIPVLRGLDLCVPALAFAHAVGRMGCFFAGCCHGKLCDLPWAMRFGSSLVTPELRGLPLHPTQLYESGGLILIGFVSLKILHRQPHKIGWATYFYMISYGALRFTVELFRGDPIRGELPIFGLSTSQGISILLFLIGSAFFIRGFRSDH